MKRSLRLIIVAAVVGLSIGGYFLVKNLPDKAPDYSPVALERYALTDSRESEIASMRFERNDGSVLFFEKIEKGEGDDKVTSWTLVSPSVLFEPVERNIKDIAYSMSSVSSNQIIEEDPSDLSIYGLDQPSATALIGFTDGTSITLSSGNKTPTRNSYYAQAEGDSNVYAVRTYSIDRFFTKLEDLRNRQISVPDSQAITYFRLAGERVIEIVKMTEDDDFIGSQFSSMKLAQPFDRERSIDTQRFSELVETIPPGLTIERFIDDAPSGLGQYGLDPARYDWTMRDAESYIHLLIGDDAGESEVYVKTPDDDMVFTLAASVLPFLDTKPFTLVDKFVLIPNIDIVNKFTMEASGKVYIGEIKRERNLSVKEGEDEDVITTYFLDGTEIEESPFKKFYQLVIGLLVDAENPDPEPMGTPDVSVVYEFNEEGPVESARADFVKLNHDFYTVYLDGSSAEFLLSAYQIDAMLDRAAELTE